MRCVSVVTAALLTCVVVHGYTLQSHTHDLRVIARGAGSVLFEGNEMTVLGLERFREFQEYRGGKRRIPGWKHVAKPGTEIVVLFLRTERVAADVGFLSRVAWLVASDGSVHEAGTVALGGPGERNLSDPPVHVYEIPFEVPRGTDFAEVVLIRGHCPDELGVAIELSPSQRSSPPVTAQPN